MRNFKKCNMKKSILFFLSFLVVLTACNTSKNGLVMKRKYTKGYYVETKSKKHNVKKSGELVKTEKPEFIEAKPVSSELVNTSSTDKEPVLTASNNKEEVASTKSVSSAKVSEKEFKTAVVGKTLYNVFAKNTLLLSSASKSKTASGKGSDTDLIIQVILALFPFICLIAIYLHDGKQITMNFWVTLILHLTFVLWLVFALLVVLDVINLA